MAYSTNKHEDYVETIINKALDTDDPQYNKEEMIYTKNGPKSCMHRMINNIYYTNLEPK